MGRPAHNQSGFQEWHVSATEEIFSTSFKVIAFDEFWLFITNYSI